MRLKWEKIEVSEMKIFKKKIHLFLFGQAAAHGLPMVATKNGGPVDIHKVLIFATHQFI
jgi:hypothetical protein